ncbi:uncharacterized protein LOC135150601 [Daucus carota subsp. sativus]|uniref:uncharacterized protein LOC135150601 n=1 Tax=Daucus carota subsp. sativus TaxID=79200 RepID=UPI00308357F0
MNYHVLQMSVNEYQKSLKEVMKMLERHDSKISAHDKMINDINESVTKLSKRLVKVETNSQKKYDEIIKAVTSIKSKMFELKEELPEFIEGSISAAHDKQATVLLTAMNTKFEEFVELLNPKDALHQGTDSGPPRSGRHRGLRVGGLRIKGRSGECSNG